MVPGEPGLVRAADTGVVVACDDFPRTGPLVVCPVDHADPVDPLEVRRVRRQHRELFGAGRRVDIDVVEVVQGLAGSI